MQPQAQIRQALSALDAAIKAEPEMADVATLKHARSLVQRVFDKNATESAPTTYTAAKQSVLAKP